MTVEVWQHLTEEQQAGYYAALAAEDVDAATRHLADALQLPDYRFDARSAIKLDYAAYILNFTKEDGLGPLKTSAVFSIGQEILKKCEGGASLEAVQDVLRDQLLPLCRPSPREDDHYLSVEDIARTTKFFASTFLQHYRLYSFAFGQSQRHTQLKASLELETPLIQSFDEAMNEGEWQAYNDAEAAAIEAREKAAREEVRARQEAERAKREQSEKEEAERKRQEELKKKPQTLEEAIDHVVLVRLEDEKTKLSKEYADREAALLEKIKDLEDKKAGA